MKAIAVIWYVFKFFVLPAGVCMGILYDAASLSELSTYLTGGLLSTFDLLASDNVDLYATFFQILTAPVALLAWMMPEGSSVFIASAAIFGQLGFYVVVTLLCWAIKPPRFLIDRIQGETQTA
ncbi:hypothetical protein RBE51_19590 [Pseudomonas taiwanensis]|uniref:hypothetical protein n=1 Tax=Pseudomonas taiwanensis TaxID=470150 RepID=UPI0028DEB50D|nr:hypothetical protein [Pseudomonas taiwanensis]MDT8924995.1 hypothetical protein [Pseudomonas taiwanensis]